MGRPRGIPLGSGLGTEGSVDGGFSDLAALPPRSKLYTADLESGLHHLLRVELAAHRSLAGAELKTLKDFVTVLAKVRGRPSWARAPGCGEPGVPGDVRGGGRNPCLAGVPVLGVGNERWLGACGAERRGVCGPKVRPRGLGVAERGTSQAAGEWAADSRMRGEHMGSREWAGGLCAWGRWRRRVAAS